MNYINDGVRGLSVIVKLNVDRLLFVSVLAAALAVATYLSHP